MLLFRHGRYHEDCRRYRGHYYMHELVLLTEYLRGLNGVGADLRATPDIQALDPAWREAFGELGRFVDRVCGLLHLLEQGLGKMGTKEALQVLQLQRLTAIIDGQNTDLQDLNQNAEELAQGVGRVAQDAHELAQAASHMSALGGTSIERIEILLGAIGVLDERAGAARSEVDALVEHSHAAAEGLRAIKGIAATSQLLALNAAIQAAHANDRAFGVVAQEMRGLATRTDSLVKELEGRVGRMESAAGSADGSMRSMSADALHAKTEAQQAAAGLGEIRRLLGDLSGSVQSIAAVSEEQAAATESMTTSTTVLAGKTAAAAESLGLTRDQSMSDVFERAYLELGGFRIGSQNEAMRDMLANMAGAVEAALEQKVSSGGLRLEDLWDTDYQLLAGPSVRQLARLFNVDRVPPGGFAPPKYRTRYDDRVDEPLIQIMDQFSAKTDLVFCTVLDLNGFCIAQPHALMQDWTGSPEADLKFNRIKRIVSDPISRKACRVALPTAIAGRERITRADLGASGPQPAGQTAASRPFLLQTYALDTGAVVLAMAMPVYVRQQRWGTVRVGYRPQE
jgi:methyl-accepting chemotaxis protein